MSEDKKDLLVIKSGESPQPFNYAVGLHGSKFFEELNQANLMSLVWS